MKKWLVFLLGIICGGVLTIGMLFLVAISHHDDNNGYDQHMNIAEEEIAFDASKFKVFQVVDNGALVFYGNDEDDMNLLSPTAFLFTGGPNQYYDGQVIEVSNDEKVMQIGTYRYETRVGERVVPLIQFE